MASENPPKSRRCRSLDRPCYQCIGLTLYSSTMKKQHKKPYCIGKEHIIPKSNVAKDYKTPYIQGDALQKKEWHNLNQLLFPLRSISMPLFKNNTIEWNFLHLPASFQPNYSCSLTSIKKKQEIYLSPLRHDILFPKQKQDFALFCFGRTIYAETFDDSLCFVPDLLYGFYHISYDKAPATENETVYTASSSSAAYLNSGDFWFFRVPHVYDWKSTSTNADYGFQDLKETKPANFRDVRAFTWIETKMSDRLKVLNFQADEFMKNLSQIIQAWRER